MKAPEVDVLVFAGCPHAPAAVALAADVVAHMAPGAELTVTDVDGPATAEALDFPGSPTLRVDGRDVLPIDSPPAINCRVYEGGAGVPPRWRLEAEMLRSLAPRSLLFLCVANSARSQMAEGVARLLAPEGVTVASAGSQPTSLRPEAAAVLAELGVDASGHRSTSVMDVDPAGVDAVITLCADEVCPTFLGDAVRVHWGLPDPADVDGDETVRLEAFRDVMVELQRRLAVVFA